jgi:hypothetical protein
MSIEGNRGVTPLTELQRLLMTVLTLVNDGYRFSGPVSGLGAIILDICHRHFRYKRGRELRFLTIVKIGLELQVKNLELLNNLISKSASCIVL